LSLDNFHSLYTYAGVHPQGKNNAKLTEYLLQGYVPPKFIDPYNNGLNVSFRFVQPKRWKKMLCIPMILFSFIFTLLILLKNRKFKTDDRTNFKQVRGSYLKGPRHPLIQFLTHFFRYTVPLNHHGF
jgi:hypothetical protein